MPVKSIAKPVGRPPEATAVRRVASAVPVRSRNGVTEFLLVRTSNGARWTFPKGGCERGESLAEAAAREALEEAGARGRVDEHPIAAYLYGPDVVTAFLLEVDEPRRPAERGREPTWFRFEAARDKLSEGRELAFDERMERVLLAAERARVALRAR